MTGSMYAAVSGLKAHMSALNVIGNNVSNVNTTGYKATRYTFNEALYTTSRAGSDGTPTSGGRNPAQVGFGASIGTIDLDMSTKNYTPTGQLLDTMIDGDGFFFVGDKEIGNGDTAVRTGDATTLKGMNLTRLGNFNIDPNGYLVDGNGSVVWGFLESTTSTEVTGPNDSPTTTTKTVQQLIDAANKAGGYNTTTGDAGYGKKIVPPPTISEEDRKAGEEALAQLHNVQKNDEGFIVSATFTINKLTAIRLPMTNGKTAEWPKYTFTEEARDSTTGDITRAQQVQMTDAEGKNAAGEDFSRLQADSVTIDEKSGALRVMTSDGQLYTVGYLAIGKVTNPNGVTHVDGRYYQAQDGAGEIRVTSVKESVYGVESAGDTKLLTGGLESSGTDLATEITNMITVQRGYQANTRIVTVTDSMLEELVNMKR